MDARGSANTFRVLAIDGGGSKGMFAIGALLELEEMLDRPCREVFDLVYGTSVGAIIAAMIAIGYDAKQIEAWFLDRIPIIMRPSLPGRRTRLLRRAIREFFGERRFDDVDMLLGIVATRIDFYRPMIFKTSADQAIKGDSTFKPGWGASLADALVGSCAAEPFFRGGTVRTTTGDIPVIDGGFVANNPCLFALTDAIYTLNRRREDVVALSVGVGGYPEKRLPFIKQLVRKYWSTQLLETVRSANTNTMSQLVAVLFKDVEIIRVHKDYTKPEYAMSFLESDPKKLTFMTNAGKDEVRERGDQLLAKLRLTGDSSSAVSP